MPSTGGTEVLTLTTGVLPSDNEATLISGTRRTGDIITITVHDSGLTGGTEPVAHTVTAADTFATIAQAFVTAINGDTKLQAIKVTASIYASSGTEANFLIKSQSPSAVHTTYTSSISSGGTETVAFRQTYYASDSVSFNHALTQDWVNINALSACGGTSHPGTGMFSNRKDYKGNYFCGGSSGFGPSLSTTAPNSTTPYSNTTAYPNNQAILSDPTNSYGSIFGSGNHEIFAEEFASQTYGDGVLSEGPNRGNTNPQSFDVYLGTNGLFSCTLAIVTIMASNGVPQGPGGNCPLN